MDTLHGLYPALVTPYKSDGSIHEKSLRQIVQLNVERNVRGFYVGGSTGEAFLLSIAERKQILDIVASEAKGKGILISHVGAISTNHAVELALHAQSVGVDAVSAIPPFYYNFTLPEIQQYYRDIMDNIQVPMIVYNFPAFSGVSITSENSKDLLADSRVAGVKHTSYDLYELDKMKQENPDIVVFNGYDEVFLAGLAMGADGAIGSTYNFMADKFLSIERLFRDGKQDEARILQGEANAVISVLIKVGLMPGIKYLLSKQGIDCGYCRPPFKTLDSSERALLDQVAARYLNTSSS